MRARNRGVTLIELMTVVGVISVLAAIAVSSYRSQLIRANRSEAKSALLRVQVAQEKFFLQRNRYALDAERTLGSPNGLGVANVQQYTLSIVTPGGVASPVTYTATATATAGQSDDTDCVTLSITETGIRTATNSAGADSSATCWR